MPFTVFEHLLLQESIKRWNEADLIFFIVTYYAVVRGHEQNKLRTAPFDLNNIKFLNFEGISNYLDLINSEGTFSIHLDEEAQQTLQQLSSTNIFNITDTPKSFIEFKKFFRLWVDKSLWHFPNEITFWNQKLSSEVEYDENNRVLSIHCSKVLTVFFKVAILRGYLDWKEIANNVVKNTEKEIQGTLLNRFLMRVKQKPGFIDVENEEISHICCWIIQYWSTIKVSDSKKIRPESADMEQYFTEVSRFPEF